MLPDYKNKIISEIKWQGAKLSRPADTLYIGGGTPSLLGTDMLNEIIEAAQNSFLGINEITVEINPKDELDFSRLKATRLSIGMQSANDDELKLLSRRHNIKDVENTIKKAQKYIKNISLDVILGIPYTNKEKLKKSLDFCINFDVPHISAYILKCEKNTPFYTSSLPFLDDDAQSDLYLFCADYLKDHGYIRYEISNFCKPGFKSRHNLKYWLNEDYLGIGPSAHSRIGSKRFYYSRSFEDFMLGKSPVYEGEAGSEDEKIMLALRTFKGYDFSDCPQIEKTALRLAKNGLINYNNGIITLTDKGALLENAITAELIDKKNRR